MNSFVMSAMGEHNLISEFIGNSIFKSRDITLPAKVRLVKAMVLQWSCMDVRVGL